MGSTAAFVLSLILVLASSVLAQPISQRNTKGMFVVQPISRTSASTAGAGELRIVRGSFFSYALPQGWHSGEQGQFALTLMAPDNQAFTVVVGNAGMLPSYPPDRYVREKLMAIRPQNLQLGPSRRGHPAAGFHHAYEFDVAYISQRGLPCPPGVAKSATWQPAYGHGAPRQ